MSRVELASVPRIGNLTVDAFEAIVVTEWRRTLGYGMDRQCVCRTVERALLLLTLARAERAEEHRIEVLLAAEAARLRDDGFVHTRAIVELDALASVFDASLRVADTSPAESTRIAACAGSELNKILAALNRVPPSTW